MTLFVHPTHHSKNSFPSKRPFNIQVAAFLFFIVCNISIQNINTGGSKGGVNITVNYGMRSK